MHGQSDLFEDNRETSLAFDVVAALVSGDVERSSEAMDRLCAAAPHHGELSQFERLQQFLN